MRQNVPSNIQEYVDRAKHFESMDKDDKAIDVLRQALVQYPDIAVLHNNLGCALANQGKYEEAKEEFLLAITLTGANRNAGIITPECYPQEPEHNLRAAESYLKSRGPAILPARKQASGSHLQLDQSRRTVMKIPEKIEFRLLDLLPIFKVWNAKNKNLLQSALALGFICGIVVGYAAGVISWGQPLYYAWYFGISVEAYALMLAIKVVEKRHYGETSFWLMPWVKLSYWFFFFLLVDGAILLLEKANPGASWLAILQSSKLPNGIAYSNTLNAVLIGIIAAFPSKIILQVLSNWLTFELPFPFSELAENTIEELIP